MTTLIAHRRNTLKDLQSTPTHLGVELDLRTLNGKLIVQHDPFLPGEDFEQWLTGYRHQLLILNVKEDGLEETLRKLLAQHKIENYFFLDQPFPSIVKCTRMKESRCAIRISEYETIDTALTMSGKVDWLWIDYFTRFPLDRSAVRAIQATKFKTCLVSPELQGHHPETEIPQLQTVLRDLDLIPNAVCTKRPDLWDPVL